MFVLQPMFGKTLLPFLGGAPAVWNTCMVVYQTLLFLGYLYAHYLSSRLNQQRQIQIHTVVIAISLIALPLALPEHIIPPTDNDPTLWLMAMLLMTIGLPFFIVTTTSPLLQKWFAETGHHTSDDPYYLYAASNAGSMIALLSYPFLIEPNIGLMDQSSIWSLAYGLLCVLIIGCGMTIWHRHKTSLDIDLSGEASTSTADSVAELSWQTKLHWLALALVPSSLLLGLTNFISTDIASAPLLWIIPLVLYLLTFVLVFSKWADKIHPVMLAVQAVVLLPFIAFCFVDPAALPFWLNLIIHLIAFFLAVMVCHGELAKHRPHTQHLTTFYLIMSFAGMLGGMFNTFVAPFIFNAVYEYPIMIIATLMLRPGIITQKLGKHILFPTLLLCSGMGIYLFSDSLSQTIIYSATNALILLAGFSYTFRSQPITLSLLTAVILFFTLGIQYLMSNTLYQQRSFFGVLSVRESVLMNENNRPERYHELFHGTTKHGAQRLATHLQTTPLTYYSRPGPMGQLFKLFDSQNHDWEIGAVGLGAGTLLCYAKPQQHWTLYEIDPLVIEVAENPKYFSYLKRCSQNSTMVLGDARLSLANEKDQYFDLLIMDAFSSDSVPTHLLTREAMALYFAKLKPNGILAFHITNRHLEIKKVISDHASHLKLSALIQEYKPQKQKPLVIATDWVVMARKPETLNTLAQSRLGNWQKLPLYFDIKPWTDDFTNIIGIWK
ncbi:MAG: fused MFS/spermidine synthase [Methylococcales symbiont of Hymedesmia sp. n. MRB-2018]|nr:MAG: fused MFS/spermidine synthase [Methylococcales symbiont of Hymedesmia sp. n. MRB-2018]